MHQLTPGQAAIVLKLLKADLNELVGRCGGDLNRASKITGALTHAPQELHVQVNEAFALLRALGYRWSPRRSWHMPPSPREQFIDLVGELILQSRGSIGCEIAARIWDEGYGSLPEESEQ